MRQLSSWAKEIRQFIFSRIVEEHQKTMDYDAPPRLVADILALNIMVLLYSGLCINYAEAYFYVVYCN